jgi:hypothetical protein
MSFYFAALPTVNGEHGFEFRDNANACIAFLAVHSDGAIGLYTGSSRTLIATSDPIISVASQQYIEAKLIIDDVVGECEVRVNGVTVLHLTNINLGTLGATQVVFGMPNTHDSGSIDYWIDDIVAWNGSGSLNNDFLGAQRVITIFPASDTAEADWSLNGAASGYDCINDPVPDGDDTYLLSTTIGDVSEFGLGTLPPETESIAGVFIPVMARISDAGVGNIQASLVSNSVAALGNDATLTTSYTYWGSVYETDPDTGVAWTKSGLEAALLRIEKTA